MAYKVWGDVVSDIRIFTFSNASESESEPALLSESGLEEADAQAIASLNSTLTRSILMLDIWLSQVNNNTNNSKQQTSLCT